MTILQRGIQAFCLFLVCVLIFAASLKLHAVLTNPFADLESGMTFSAIWTIVLFEFAVVLSILLIRNTNLTVQILAFTFSAFAIYAATSILNGKTKCGCFGAFELSLYWTFTFNLFVSLILFTYIFLDKKPLLQNLSRLRSMCTDANFLSHAIPIVVVLCMVLAISVFQDVSSIVGNSLGIKTQRRIAVNVGDVECNKVLKKKVALSEFGITGKVKLIGIESSCMCLTARGPEASEHSSETLQLEMRPRKPGFFHQRVVCYTDGPFHKRIQIDVHANVLSERK